MFSCSSPYFGLKSCVFCWIDKFTDLVLIQGVTPDWHCSTYLNIINIKNKKIFYNNNQATSFPRNNQVSTTSKENITKQASLFNSWTRPLIYKTESQALTVDTSFSSSLPFAESRDGSSAEAIWLTNKKGEVDEIWAA